VYPCRFLQKGVPLSAEICRKEIYRKVYPSLQRSVDFFSTEIYRKVPLSAEICRFIFMQNLQISTGRIQLSADFCRKRNLQISAERGTFL
jgi:hypothetical protein